MLKKDCFQTVVVLVNIAEAFQYSAVKSRMIDNFIHHGPSARAHVPYSVLEFKRRSNYQQRNKWNFALP